ncbi:Uu.00g120940.m01.CDS01 [Anthostomella pinea]|uniref:Uu.00g120940.m01.CDS01 n=1 Tax=Anthostomella pinea TaxID=933095 RepID=A0AAI8VGX0_9PEZI|nr:Uu.00g120940.m01.CDS01 [Anthostomella pinea]
MLIDGEKWACEACVRGHRVSNCQHSDRPLQHINKKGRPVSQCHHCRSMRKSRSSHIKCDCGEKTHKCAHLQQTLEGHKESCCCNHGGRCSCSHRKEPSLDTVPESESDLESSYPAKPKPISRRRRANTGHSEPILSFDENGHHKPAHKPTKASQKCGPYTLSRGSSMHSMSSASSSLGIPSADGLAQRGKTGARSRTATASSGSERETRMTESPQASPSMEGDSTFQQLNGQLPPLDLSGIQYPEYSPAFDLFGVLSDHEAPMFSAGLSAASVDWTQYDGLELKGEDFAPSSFGQAQSYKGFDLAGSVEPTLTSNSGDVSETEDWAPTFGNAQLEGFRSGPASGYLDLSQNQTTMLTSADLGTLDFDQFKGTADASKYLSNPSVVDEASPAFPLDDTYWNMSNFNDGITESPDLVASCLWAT